jgi:cobalt-zinc-cadmium efflux system protein
MIHGHHHHPRASSGAERVALRRALVVTGILFLAEVVGGLWANSLALLSDAGHMLTDLLSLGLGAAAISFATRPADRKRSFGYYRLEILSALANGILLALVAGGILLEAVRRFGSPPEVRVEILAPVAVAGLVANILVILWLARAQGGLSTRAALWHASADGASSVLVILAAVAMALTGWWWLDPGVSILLAGVVVYGAYRLLRESVHVLLESTPYEVDLVRLHEALAGLDGVEGVHDVHVWSLTSQVHALSAHVRVRPEQLTEADRILAAAKNLLEHEFGITHTTLQVESRSCGGIVCVLQPDGSPETPPAAGPDGGGGTPPDAPAPPTERT